jgi:SAM-dependent methyltransferase
MGADGISRKYYDETYYAGHVRRLRSNDRFTRVKIQRLFDLLVPEKDELILDLGSGVGTVLIALANVGANAMGFDYSFKSLCIAKANYGGHFSVQSFRALCCDGTNIGIRSNSLDAIAAVDFTEHLDDAMLVPTLAEVYRILKRGGRFVMYTPNRTHLFERIKKRNIILKEDKSHIGLRTMNEYRTLLSQAGFTITKSYFRPTDIPVFNILENIAMQIPIICTLARRRICISAQK